MTCYCYCILLCIASLCYFAGSAVCINSEFYINDWAVNIHGGMQVADRVAADHGFRNLGQAGELEDIYRFRHLAVTKRRKRSTLTRTIPLIWDRRVSWVEQQRAKRRVKRSSPLFNDARWPDQWYLHRRQPGYKGKDMNVVEAWNMNFTGRGVVVTIVDDGIEHTHPELQQNFDKLASYDYNDDDWDPTPVWSWNNDIRHGTRCAAEVAAVANNSICIVGVAYNAKIGGIRMLDGDVSDMTEAMSFRHQRDHVDIYSASWGPEDDGRTVDGPGALAQVALRDGAMKGRKGRGNIFVFASGNGGSRGDNCNCDGYTSSIYTISVSGTTSDGTVPWYLESCAPSLVTTYSTGVERVHERIVTADLHKGCTSQHSGTSVAAPMVAGFAALVLEVNPFLTWRDVQHLFVNTAKMDNLVSDEIATNGAGRRFSHRFGYGVVDGGALVRLAKKWPLVSAQHSCRIPMVKKRRIFNSTHHIKMKVNVSGCQGTSNHVEYIEHVHIIMSLFHQRRGAVSIFITSPMGTRSQILTPRKLDTQRSGFKAWPFMSVHFWGENPVGEWLLEVYSIGSPGNGLLEEWQLVIYGTDVKPGTRNGVDIDDYIKRVPGCHEQCVDGCTGPTASQCTRCAHYAIESDVTECVEQCPDGYYAIPGKHVCGQCHASCQTCDNSNAFNCLSCHEDFVLMNKKCQRNCPEGMYETKLNRQNICKKCSANCDACLDGSTCVSCTDGYKLIDTKSCVPQCADGYFPITRYHCHRCHPTCQTCNGRSVDNCTSCPRFHELGHDELTITYLNGSHCLRECPIRMIADNTAGRCLKCPKHCLKCSQQNAMDCLVCEPGHMLLQREVSKCVKKCPPGFSTDALKRTCRSCATECLQCVNGRSDDCTACQRGRYLKKSSCVFADECQYGTFANQTALECQLCPFPCASCDPYGECTGCRYGFYMNNRKQCVRQCPKGTFVHEVRSSCLACHKHCATCFDQDKDKCLSCKPGRYLFENRCVQKCPRIGYYQDNEARECHQCHWTCSRCTGPGEDQCKACIGNLDLRTSSCHPPCLDRYLAENSCEFCHSSCKSCYGPNATQCLSCSANATLNPDAYSCKDKCDSGYYQLTNTQICNRCHRSCKTCFGPKDNHCLSCGGTNNLFNGTCVRNCPIGHFKSTSSPKCIPCDYPCQQCLYRPYVCTSCSKDHFWDYYKCVKQCGNNKFVMKNSNRCLNCHPTCLTCYGFSANHCKSCIHGYILHENTCVTQCPVGFYKNGSKCSPCKNDCLQCQVTPEKHVCLSCKPPAIYWNNECVTTCPLQGYYFNAVDNRCSKCHPACTSCFGPSIYQCHTCHPLFKLDGFECKSKCPDGEFADASVGLCRKCHPSCSTCRESDSSINCTSCPKFSVYTRQLGTCSPTCPQRYYQLNNTCRPCHVTCQKCSGPSLFECDQCKYPFFFLNRTCVESCPAGMYLKRKANIVTCANCPSHCTSCNGPSETSCTICRFGYYFQEGRCVLRCGKDYIHQQMGKICIPCGQHCKLIND